MVVADAGEDFRRLLSQAIGAEADLVLVGETGDGEELVELCKTKAPDVVVMDMILSNIDGVEVLGQIGELSAKPRVLVVSSFASGSVADLAAARGADYFMMKPCRTPAVIERVRQMAAASRGEEETEPRERNRKAPSPLSFMRSAYPPTSKATSISGRLSSLRLTTWTSSMP